MIFGLITPCSFTSNGVLTKHLTSEKVGFNPSRISFSAYLLVNLIVLVFAIPYWVKIEYSSYLFWVGFAGSIINTLGIVSIQIALSCGPAGPISAIAAVASILLVVIEAFKTWKMLSFMEFIGLIFGIYGALVLVIPTFFEKMCCFCCLDKFKEKKVEEPAYLANQKLNGLARETNLDAKLGDLNQN